MAIVTVQAPNGAPLLVQVLSGPSMNCRSPVLVVTQMSVGPVWLLLLEDEELDDELDEALANVLLLEDEELLEEDEALDDELLTDDDDEDESDDELDDDELCSSPWQQSSLLHGKIGAGQLPTMSSAVVFGWPSSRGHEFTTTSSPSKIFISLKVAPLKYWPTA